ncbi:nucleotidyltransferase family protein [Deinococcus sp.]|uniref:nucleotidyltransferase family protein n=1 Tax=Deinococcus sp. TaxID=47478 RepID=UPI0025C68627|nr:nucleotidyltransferase family protein [Deinococcus sp.]
MSTRLGGPRVVGVLLAAGRSTRMRHHTGQLKQLSSLGGTPLCRHAALALAEAGFASLLAVVPAGEPGEQIQEALAGLGFGFVVNPDPTRGLASSFRVAAQALEPRIDAAQFALADMPFVTAQTHRAVLEIFGQSRAPVVLTRYGEQPSMQAGVHAPPNLFRADLLPELAALPDQDQGPRELVRRFAGQLLAVQRPALELTDIDTPQQLAAAQAL